MKVYTKQEASVYSGLVMNTIENRIQKWRLEGYYKRKKLSDKYTITHISQEWVDLLKKAKENRWKNWKKYEKKKKTKKYITN